MLAFHSTRAFVILCERCRRPVPCGSMWFRPSVSAAAALDMVGDCVGLSADVFESVAAEIIGAMILGSTLANETGMDATTSDGRNSGLQQTTRRANKRATNE